MLAEIKSEMEKEITANEMLAIIAIFIDEEITPFTFPSSFFPLKYAMYLGEPVPNPSMDIVAKMLIITSAKE